MSGPRSPRIRPDATESLTASLRDRVLVIDGAMGTMLQGYGLTEADYRGSRFADSTIDLRGNSDILCLTRPDIVTEIHQAYLEAGADIVCTNTFTASSISQADYDLAGVSYELTKAAAALARDAADAFATAEQPRYVAGALGPTNRTASMSPEVNDPGARNVTYDELVSAYLEQASGLGRRGSRPAPDRDDLRHPQRQGGDLRPGDLVRGARAALADHHLGNDHRRVGADAIRPGHRGLLELRPARQAPGHRTQLRPRRQGDPALHRRVEPPRELLHLHAPQQRIAERFRRVRRQSRSSSSTCWGSSRPAGWSTSSAGAAALPRSTSSTLQRHCRCNTACASRQAACHAPVRARAAQYHRGEPLRQRR